MMTVNDDRLVLLEKGEMICPECNGSGSIGECNINFSKHKAIEIESMPNICQKCKGNGKLDWIENLVGKEKYYTIPWKIDTGLVNNLYYNNISKKIAEDIDNTILEKIINIVEDKDEKGNKL